MATLRTHLSLGTPPRLSAPAFASAIDTLRRSVAPIRRNPPAWLACVVCITWIATFAFALVSIQLAVAIAAALAVTAPPVVAVAYRGVPSLLFGAIVGIAFGAGLAVSVGSLPDATRALAFAFAAIGTALSFAVAVVSDSLARDRAFADRARLRAEERVTLSEEYVSFIAHEIRTPMTTIAGTAEVLRRHGATLADEARREALSDIESDISRLSHLADDLLAIAHRTHDERHETTALPIPGILDEAVSRHRKAFRNREIVLSIQDRGLVADASPLLVSHVITNLMINAEKYSPTSFPIEIRAVARAGMLDISVHDSGEGVSPAETDAIFSPFYRSPATRAKVDGHGLGLALCRRLMEVQGGALWLEEPGAISGTTFHMALPLARP